MLEPGPNSFSIEVTHDGPRHWLICDPDAKLVHNCRVVVLHEVKVSLLGTVRTRRPVTFRRIQIDWVAQNGESGTDKFGARDPDTRIARVVGKLVPVEYEDCEPSPHGPQTAEGDPNV